MSNASHAADLVASALSAGADAADVLVTASTQLSVQRRLGAIEQLERAEATDFGLRVLVGRRQAIISMTDAHPDDFVALAERAVGIARVVPEDPFAGLAEGLDPQRALDLDLADTAEPDVDMLLRACAEAEEAALAVPGVTNSEGAEAGWSRTVVYLAASNGFVGSYVRTGYSLSVTAVAGTSIGMERDYDHCSAVHWTDLEEPTDLGKRAGAQAVARLNARRPATARLPVVYAPRVASSVVGHLVNAVNGAAVARGTSFLRGQMGRPVMAKGLSIIDDPMRHRGLRSRPFDSEGVAGSRLAIVQDGTLMTWLLDCRSARQLGLQSTGHASRGVGGPPSPGPTNIWLQPGEVTPAALMADIREGLYVTELIGMGVNAVTGDYSRGASGFMIRDGGLAEPVSGVTIAGRLPEMLMNLAPANDLVFRRGTDSPTIRVDGLTMAGT